MFASTFLISPTPWIRKYSSASANHGCCCCCECCRSVLSAEDFRAERLPGADEDEGENMKCELMFYKHEFWAIKLMFRSFSTCLAGFETLINLMGKRRPHHYQARKAKRTRSEGGEGDAVADDPRRGYANFVTDADKFNPIMENYYKSFDFCPPEEWETFMAKLKIILPTTFRLTGTRRHAFDLRDYLKREFIEKLKSDPSYTGVHVPSAIPWYPDELGYGFEVSRREVRSNPVYRKLHKFLVTETDVGNISRQEAVSMIPPLLLDIQPHHYVLDMCAAPGSKTAQILEAVQSKNIRGDTGLVVANDADSKRSYLLVHQTRRVQSPSLVVTNVDASRFPSVLLSGPEEEPRYLRFDRILCDVPCSGDGTIRKNLNIWKQWSGSNAQGLHQLQIEIFTRGCQLLKVGGRIVYSTCSFNPIENEAVLATVLQRCKGSLELLDVSHELPGLIRKNGLKTWKVMDRKNAIYSSFSEVPEEDRRRLPETMFPPSPEIAEELNLSRCIRIYPHFQDTGGFFIAVLQKTGPIGKLDEMEAQKPQDGEHSGETDLTHGKKFSKTRFRGFKDEPFSFLGDEHEIVKEISAFYGLTAFPKDLLTIRSLNENFRGIYYVSANVKELIKATERSGNEALKLVNAGLKVFSRVDRRDAGECSFRLQQEGINIVAPFLERRLVDVTNMADMKAVLGEQDNVNTNTFSMETQTALAEKECGSIVFRYQDPSPTSNSQPKEPLHVVVWKGKVKIASMVARKERLSLLIRVDPSTEYVTTEIAAGNDDAVVADGEVVADDAVNLDGESGGGAEVEDEDDDDDHNGDINDDSNVVNNDDAIVE